MPTTLASSNRPTSRRSNTSRSTSSSGTARCSQSDGRSGDPDRIQWYEMAFRMQAPVPEPADTSGEPAHVYELYGKDSKVVAPTKSRHGRRGVC
ncbi:DUF1501 domain-containing protein [Luteolibacter arcticus]|uniref:DUF1501 domain-containing protein n=1 Tax=Luteolibacter arcticus TaxID=1581411 RepID=A0ABT3GNG1_9BACT|nr:DUF1501 domain-containing protein [Luteolibacter arcticus]MCW1925037.1 DUF1501 domain-containing protein [Luteolibacter arcticus]